MRERISNTKLAADMAEKTSDAYMADSYANWKMCAKALYDRGYDSKQVEAILRSKWMRWAADQANKGSNVPTKAITNWLDTSFKNRAEELCEVKCLTAETFGMQQLVEPAKKSVRIEELMNEIDRLAQELYLLVAPTEEELELTHDVVMEDREAAEVLFDQGTTIGKLSLAFDAVAFREGK